MTGACRFHGVLFDKDGTLFDFQASWAGWMKAVLDRLSRGNVELARNAGLRVGFDTGRGRFSESSSFVAAAPEDTLRVFAQCFPEWAAPEITGLMVEASQDFRQVEAVPLQPLFLKMRESGLLVGIVTNDWESVARSHLQEAGILKLCDFVAGSDSGFGTKPDPGMLLAFCERFGIAPRDTVMVGDSQGDLVAGRNAGMSTVGVLTGTERMATLRPLADAVFESIGGLTGWLGLEKDPD